LPIKNYSATVAAATSIAYVAAATVAVAYAMRNAQRKRPLTKTWIGNTTPKATEPTNYLRYTTGGWQGDNTRFSPDFQPIDPIDEPFLLSHIAGGYAKPGNLSIFS